MTGRVLQIRLLGPVDVTAGAAMQKLSGLRRKTVLAVMALHAGEVVSTDRLVDIVWGEDPPLTAVSALQNHMSYLRSVLGRTDGIVAVSQGYLLEVPPDAIDALRAESLIRRGGRSEDHVSAVARLRTALELWRGPALSDVTGPTWLDEQAVRLEELRTEATQSLMDTRLALGEHARLLPELERLVQLHPFREQFHRQLMLALYRSGRQADALAAYRRLRRSLKVELGVDPSSALSDLEAAILRHDTGLDPLPPPIISAAPPARRSPAQQLPLTAHTFTGRRAELIRMDELAAVDEVAADTVTIVVISGTPGVGKTTLALHWAHRVADRFPDGQLYVNLRGYDPAGTALRPADVIRQFLHALGVQGEQLPPDLDAQVGLYRSMLAGKRVLVVLDNARDVHQVRPLLPGGPGCLAVVTSRDQLIALVAAEGAHPIPLELLSTVDAHDLLDRRLGLRRTRNEPNAVWDIITRCAGLPLALAIVAARAATQPHLSLTAAASELRDATATLDSLNSGDPATDVRAVFSWSYQTLSPPAARLYRLCGLHPGPDFTAAAVASLVALPLVQVRRLLNELIRANLMVESVPGRYAFHDLLRAYATGLAHTVDTDEQRHAAMYRLLDHYLHTAYTADRLLHPAGDPITLAPPQPGAAAEQPADREGARAWCTAEHRVILAAVQLAADAGFDTHVWQLARAFDTFLNRGGHWHDLAGVWQIAIGAADRLDDVSAQAQAHLGRARVEIRLGRTDDALVNLRRALNLYRRLGDPAGQAHIHFTLVRVYEGKGRHRDSLNHAQQALTLFSAAGHQFGQARAFNAVGWCHTLLSDHAQALTFCEQALTLFQHLGDRYGQAVTWDSLGHAHHHLDHHPQAVACYQHAIDLLSEAGDRYNVAVALTHLGDTHHAAGATNSAHDAWQQALDILVDLGHPDADEVSVKLKSLETPGGG